MEFSIISSWTMGATCKMKTIKELYPKYGITWKYNLPGHHNATAAVEIVNQTLFNKLKKLSKHNQSH